MTGIRSSVEWSQVASKGGAICIRKRGRALYVETVSTNFSISAIDGIFMNLRVISIITFEFELGSNISRCQVAYKFQVRLPFPADGNT